MAEQAKGELDVYEEAISKDVAVLKALAGEQGYSIEKVASETLEMLTVGATFSHAVGLLPDALIDVAIGLWIKRNGEKIAQETVLQPPAGDDGGGSQPDGGGAAL